MTICVGLTYLSATAPVWHAQERVIDLEGIGLVQPRIALHRTETFLSRCLTVLTLQFPTFAQKQEMSLRGFYHDVELF